MSQKHIKKINGINEMIFEGNIIWTQNDTFVVDGMITSKNEHIKIKGNIENMFPELREKYNIRSLKITGIKKRF